MNDASPQKILLADYAPPAYLVDDVYLNFRLADSATRVYSRIRFRPNPATEDRRFFLHGEGLTRISTRIAIDHCDVPTRKGWALGLMQQRLTEPGDC